MRLNGTLIIVGLGPGSPKHLTQAASEALSSYPVVVRTRQHPVAKTFPGSECWESCDDLYETANSFATVYEEIVRRVIDRARRTSLVYAVPGHPLVGEATVRRLLDEAPKVGLHLEIIPGLSFVDAALPFFGIDALAEHLQIVDALELVTCLDASPFAGGRWPLSPLRPAVLGQVYDRTIAGHVKLALQRIYPDTTPVTIVRGAGTDAPQREQVALPEIDRLPYDATTAIFLPSVSEREARVTEALQRVVARLRAPGGCPWDREQTHESLRRHLVEEAYEVLDAIDEGDDGTLCEELGDLLLQVIMHAQLAEERGAFVYEDAVAAVIEKLVRRHPHVFGDASVESASEVLVRWEAIKAAERATHPGAGRLLPSSLPALARAQKLLRILKERDPERYRSLSVPPTERADVTTDRTLLPKLISLVSAAVEAGIDIEQLLRTWTLEQEEQLINDGSRFQSE